MEKTIKKTRFDGQEVEILGETYEQGMPSSAGLWRPKLRNRKEMLNYLRSGERYWFNDDWYGSERRKTKA